MYKADRRGFTLIELLVVIVIIAILAAILFPVFSSARGKARQSTCASNMKQISIAFRQYIDDWGGFCPPLVNEDQIQVTFGGSNYTTGIWIMNQANTALLDRYMRTKEFLCPSDEYNKQIDKARDSAGNRWPFYTSYGYNNIYLARQEWYGRSWVHPGPPTVRIDTIRRPSRTVAFADKDHRNEPVLLPPGNLPQRTTSLPSEFTPYSCIGKWHNEGANVAFVDGHVTWMRADGPLTKDVTLWNGTSK